MSVGIETIQDSGSNTLANGLGVSHHVRGLMSYWIRTQTDHRISRTTVKRVTNLEQQVIRINLSAIHRHPNQIVTCLVEQVIEGPDAMQVVGLVQPSSLLVTAIRLCVGNPHSTAVPFSR